MSGYVGRMGVCSQGRIGIIEGRKTLPWGESWIGTGLDGEEWASREPRLLSPEQQQALELGGDANDAGVRSEHSADVTPPAGVDTTMYSDRGDDRLREIQERLEYYERLSKLSPNVGAASVAYDHVKDVRYLLAEVERLRAEVGMANERVRHAQAQVDGMQSRLRALEAALREVRPLWVRLVEQLASEDRSDVEDALVWETLLPRLADTLRPVWAALKGEADE